jgi:hypothetical protein
MRRHPEREPSEFLRELLKGCNGPASKGDGAGPLV